MSCRSDSSSLLAKVMMSSMTMNCPFLKCPMFSRIPVPKSSTVVRLCALLYSSASSCLTFSRETSQCLGSLVRASLTVVDLPVEELEMKDDGGGFFFIPFICCFLYFFLQKCFFVSVTSMLDVCVCDINVGFVWQKNVTRDK